MSDLADKITGKPDSGAEALKNLSAIRLGLQDRLFASGMARLRALETVILESMPAGEQAAWGARLDELTKRFLDEAAEEKPR